MANTFELRMGLPLDEARAIMNAIWDRADQLFGPMTLYFPELPGG